MGATSSSIENDIWRPKPRFPSSSQREEDGSVIVGKGTRVFVYKQDPKVKVIGYREMWLLEDVSPGPSTPLMTVKGMPSDYGPTDHANNYLYTPNINEEAFDAVNTLAIVTHVHWMYKRALIRVQAQDDLKWQFPGPIEIHPLAGDDTNAYYERYTKSLRFFHFKDDTGKKIKICRSWDVVAHEAGHAILDSLKPSWLLDCETIPEVGALHETFGDITAIFSLLDQMDMCEAIVTHSKGNLRDRENMLAVIGEEFAEGIGRPFGLRNATVDLTVSRATTEIHEFSRVFTGAVYDILVHIFEESINMDKQQPAEALYFAARHVLSVFLVAVLDGPRIQPTFRDIASLMIKTEPEARFKAVMQEEFTRREIFSEWAKPRPHVPSYATATQDITDGPDNASETGPADAKGKGRKTYSCSTIKQPRLSDTHKTAPQEDSETSGGDEKSSWMDMVIPVAVLALASFVGIVLAMSWRQ